MNSKRRSGCPLNVTLEVFGDRWSLLIVRDLMFKGRTTFKEFQQAEEGIATNILTDRLERLEAHGIVGKQRDPSDARRVIYRLTEKGIDLAPILVEMILWSARHEQTDAPPSVIRRMREDREQFLADIRSRWAGTRTQGEARND
jgi:DNA-binding HxlR family transcriptional regulator